MNYIEDITKAIHLPPTSVFVLYGGIRFASLSLALILSSRNAYSHQVERFRESQFVLVLCDSMIIFLTIGCQSFCAPLDCLLKHQMHYSLKLAAELVFGKWGHSQISH